MPPRTHGTELRIDTPAGAVTLFARDARDGGYTGTVTVGNDLTTVTLG